MYYFSDIDDLYHETYIYLFFYTFLFRFAAHIFVIYHVYMGVKLPLGLIPGIIKIRQLH